MPTNQEWDVIKETFRGADENKDGFISRNELQSVFSLLGCDLDLQCLMDAADKNADGRLCYEEFIDFVKASQLRMPGEIEALISAKIEECKSVGMDWMASFGSIG